MKNNKLKNISIFIFGMVTFALGYFIVSTFIFVERPSRDGIVEDWEQICFWPDVDGVAATVSPKGCYSPTCTRPTLQAGTAIVDRQAYEIQLETRFVLVEASRFPLPCVESCEGGGSIFFNLGHLMPSRYDVSFRGEKVGELDIYSGLPTERQCFENK
jgi:hypothetical protein